MTAEVLSPQTSQPGRFGAALILRLAFRDLRLGWSGFAIFIACIALGVAAIAGRWQERLRRVFRGKGR
jgi:putative ABC transport system permease protein